MSTNVQPSAMRRKAGVGRPPPEIGPVTPARALSTALVQAAQEVAGLVAVTGSVEERRLTLGPLVDDLPESPLLALIEGTQGRFGLMALDPQILAALVEIQTTGRVAPRPAPARTPTRTDAIMCADFIDRALELVETRLAEAERPDAPLYAGFRYALALDDARALALALDDVPYRRFTVELDLGPGAKAGRVALVVPHDPPRRGPRGDAVAFTAALQAQVLEAEAQLTAVLARRQMSLAEVARLNVGAVIPFARGALDTVELIDLEGRVLAQGRLGQADGRRALRLKMTPVAPAPAEGFAGIAPPAPARRIAPAAEPSAAPEVRGTPQEPAPGPSRAPEGAGQTPRQDEPEPEAVPVDADPAA